MSLLCVPLGTMGAAPQGGAVGGKETPSQESSSAATPSRPLNLGSQRAPHLPISLSLASGPHPVPLTELPRTPPTPLAVHSANIRGHQREAECEEAQDGPGEVTAGEGASQGPGILAPCPGPVVSDKRLDQSRLWGRGSEDTSRSAGAAGGHMDTGHRWNGPSRARRSSGRVFRKGPSLPPDPPSGLSLEAGLGLQGKTRVGRLGARAKESLQDHPLLGMRARGDPGSPEALSSPLMWPCPALPGGGQLIWGAGRRIPRTQTAFSFQTERPGVGRGCGLEGNLGSQPHGAALGT